MISKGAVFAFLTFYVCYIFASELLTIDIYVSPNGKDNPNGGTKNNPFKTLCYALQEVQGSSSFSFNIYLAEGTYNVSNCSIQTYNQQKLLVEGEIGTNNTIKVNIVGSNSIPIYIYSSVSFANLKFSNLLSSPSLSIGTSSSRDSIDVSFSHCLFENNSGNSLSIEGKANVQIYDSFFNRTKAFGIPIQAPLKSSIGTTITVTSTSFISSIGGRGIQIGTANDQSEGELSIHNSTFEGFENAIYSSNSAESAYGPFIKIVVTNSNFTDGTGSTIKLNSGSSQQASTPNSQLLLSGVKIANNTLLNKFSSYPEGPLYVGPNSVAIVANSYFGYNNFSLVSNSGGGITVSGGQAYITDTKFDYNLGNLGGAIRCNGNGGYSSLIVINSEFNYNNATKSNPSLACSSCQYTGYNNINNTKSPFIYSNDYRC